jgi:hypothetical protein
MNKRYVIEVGQRRDVFIDDETVTYTVTPGEGGLQVWAKEEPKVGEIIIGTEAQLVRLYGVFTPYILTVYDVER